MNFEVLHWSISEIVKQRESLSLNPRYQRGEAWSEQKQSLLIDTILMGYDIPKIYLSKNKLNSLKSHDVIDGQQRLRAIFHFLGHHVDVKGKPLVLKKRHGLEWSDRDSFTFEDLDPKESSMFLRRKITVTLVDGATNDQLRRLFLRLQMGSSLNQAELRNALSSQIGDNVNAIVENHNFFRVTAIPQGRYKRQDYLAQALVYVRGQDKGEVVSIDAEMTKTFYLEVKTPSMTFWKKVNSVLDKMELISRKHPRCFYNKWMFVDLFVYLWSNNPKIDEINSPNIAEQLADLEAIRVSIRKSPESLVGKRGESPKILLGYVDAFYKDGGLSTNLQKRQNFIKNQHSKLFEL